MAVGHPAVGPWQGVFSGKVSDEEWHTFCNWLREWRDVLNNTGRVRDAAIPEREIFRAENGASHGQVLQDDSER